jgi:hypothetical protein
LYTPDDTLFQFPGARLLSAMFPAFPANLAHELTALAAAGTEDDVGFILQVLRAYQGQQTTQEVVKELVARLPEETGAWIRPKFAFKAPAWSAVSSDSSKRIEREKRKSRHG